MKTFLRLLKWFFFGILGILLIIIILLALDSDYQSAELLELDKAVIRSQKEYVATLDSIRYNDLLQKFGKNKKLPEGFELQSLLALSHYPELRDARIDFQIQPAFLPLASRPEPKSILFPWIRRKYLVVISNESTDFFEPILLSNTPFNEQVGILGHELAHTVYYLDKSALQITHIAIRYPNNRFATEFERKADKIAIAHGLGYQLYDFAFFVRKAFGQSQEQIEAEEGDRYLSPKEIRSEMSNYKFYADSPDNADTYFID